MANSWHVWQNRVRLGENHLGRAVYAKRAFRAGQTIGIIQGIVCREADYGSAFCMDLGRGRSLEPILPFRCLNHSCQPNAELVGIDFNKEGTDGADLLLLDAVREIAIGEEITIDYAWDSNNAIECFCGSPNCRGWVVAATSVTDLPPVLKDVIRPNLTLGPLDSRPLRKV